jgi:Fe-S-cluster containining protein
MADFACQRCGQCCVALFATLTTEDLHREPRLSKVVVYVSHVGNSVTRQYMLEHNHRWAIRKDHRGGPCPFLRRPKGELARCAIHETRPQICRDYPQGAMCMREEQESASNTKRKS